MFFVVQFLLRAFHPVCAPPTNLLYGHFIAFKNLSEDTSAYVKINKISVPCVLVPQDTTAQTIPRNSFKRDTILLPINLRAADGKIKTMITLNDTS